MRKNLHDEARDLATTGEFENLSKVENALIKRGFTRPEVDGHLFGKATRAELNALCKGARKLVGENADTE